MRQIAPARKRAFLHDFKSRQIKRQAPPALSLKCAWPSAAAPLSIMGPANNAVPPKQRHVFVNNRQPAFTQYSVHFIQHELWILCMMQHIAKQNGVEPLIPDGEATPVVGKVIDASGSAAADIQADDRCAEDALQMMRDKAIAAADVENVCAWRQHLRHFKRHVVCSSDFSAASHALEAPFDRGG
jgi:hypothetical protein